MSATLRVPSAAALRNRGVPVPVHRLVLDEAGVPKRPAERVYENDEPVLDEAWVRFDNNVLADIEDAEWGWGGLTEWEQALDDAPSATIRRTLALCWGVNSTDREALRIVGSQMVDDLDLYSTALGAAFLLANGGSPEAAGKAIMQGVGAIKSKKDLVASAIDKALQDEPDDESGTQTSPSGPAGTPGTTGTEPGSESVETPSSSGDLVPIR